MTSLVFLEMPSFRQSELALGSLNFHLLKLASIVLYGGFQMYGHAKEVVGKEGTFAKVRS